ncbi:helix-turn-helix domain-containing protein [Nonomuraea sp. NPDC049709]|uniref:helix-turn-helix domain-containing protein n=1 Tax=Nonomuraea sp. NPDC049709 TaxID=3154736 RepID=UPI00344A8754
MGDRDKDIEILALRHQISVLERQLGADSRVRFAPEDRAFLTELLVSLPREVLRRLRLLVRPDTVLRWHRDLMKRRHARTCRPKRPGRPPTVQSIRALILRLVQENPGWGYRRVHGELSTLGIKVAPSTVWEILKQEGLEPAPERASITWADFLRRQADALLAADFFETITLNGQRQYILAVIEHATRRVRVLGTTAHPSASWVTQAMKSLVMDLDDAGCRARFLLRDRDGKFPAPHGCDSRRDRHHDGAHWYPDAADELEAIMTMPVARTCRVQGVCGSVDAISVMPMNFAAASTSFVSMSLATWNLIATEPNCCSRF